MAVSSDVKFCFIKSKLWLPGPCRGPLYSMTVTIVIIIIIIVDNHVALKSVMCWQVRISCWQWRETLIHWMKSHSTSPSLVKVPYAMIFVCLLSTLQSAACVLWVSILCVDVKFSSYSLQCYWWLTVFMIWFCFLLLGILSQNFDFVSFHDCHLVNL